MNAKEYLAQLAQAAELSPEERDALLKVADKEKFSKGLEEGVMLRSDYSRQSDELKKTQAKTTDYYQTLVQWKAGEDARLAAGNGAGEVINGEYLTKKDLEVLDKKYQDELGRRDGTFVGLLQVGMELASQHVNEFHEKLDAKGLRKLAEEKGLSLEQAYNEMVAPRRAEVQSKSFADQIAKAREEGARDFASKHKIPVDTAAREYHVMLDRDPSGKAAGITDYEQNSGRLNTQQSRTLRENFVSEWDKAGTQTSST